MKFIEPEGATPLDPDEISGLKSEKGLMRSRYENTRRFLAHTEYTPIYSQITLKEDMSKPGRVMSVLDRSRWKSQAE